MATNRYLKTDLLTNIPKKVRMLKRAGTYPETDYNTKEPTGKMQTLYIFEDDKGEAKHYAKEREEETLKDFSPGDEVVVTRQEMEKDGKRIAYLVWTMPGDITLNNPSPLRSNVAQNTEDKHQVTYQEDQRTKGIEIGLRGLVQAYIIQGHPDALAKAIEMDALVRMAAINLSKPAKDRSQSSL